MTISTKVANGMMAAGLAGVLGSAGSFGYLVYATRFEHPQVTELLQKMNELSDKYGKCISSYADDGYCQRIKEKYRLLSQQKDLFDASKEHSQFQEKQSIYSIYFHLRLVDLLFHFR